MDLDNVSTVEDLDEEGRQVDELSNSEHKRVICRKPQKIEVINAIDGQSSEHSSSNSVASKSFCVKFCEEEKSQHSSSSSTKSDRIAQRRKTGYVWANDELSNDEHYSEHSSGGEKSLNSHGVRFRQVEIKPNPHPSDKADRIAERRKTGFERSMKTDDDSQYSEHSSGSEKGLNSQGVRFCREKNKRNSALTEKDNRISERKKTGFVWPWSNVNDDEHSSDGYEDQHSEHSSSTEKAFNSLGVKFSHEDNKLNSSPSEKDNRISKRKKTGFVWSWSKDVKTDEVTNDSQSDMSTSPTDGLASNKQTKTIRDVACTSTLDGIKVLLIALGISLIKVFFIREPHNRHDTDESYVDYLSD